MRHSSAKKTIRRGEADTPAGGPESAPAVGKTVRSGPPPVVLDHRATGEYACEMLSSLRVLTLEAKLDFLTYLLDMAYEEAAKAALGPGNMSDEENEGGAARSTPERG